MGENSIYSQIKVWLRPFVYMAIIAIVVIVLPYFLDRLLGFPKITNQDWINTLQNMPEVFAGVLGIAITVVAIIVELAANRYTPKITELFFLSKTNYIIMGFFVISAIQCIWISFEGAPYLGIQIAFFNITIAMLLLLPYFVYVLHFLDPFNIIKLIKEHTLGFILSCNQKGVNKSKVENQKSLTIRGIEQLTDISLNAITNKDKGVAMVGVDTLKELIFSYISIKQELVKEWFSVSKTVANNPDFISMTEEVLQEIEKNKVWFEMKILRQYQMLYNESLNKLRDINYLIGINTRIVGEKAMELQLDQLLYLVIKFFNTYLRATLNAKDVRTAYNVLNQYRLLGETALRKNYFKICEDIANYFKYYGQLAFSMGLPFILETVAYDLCRLNEIAYKTKAPNLKQLLSIFLEVDKESEEPHEYETTLRGVRKAQVKLATFYLVEGALDLARLIYEDMKNETPFRLRSIKTELHSITSKDFWEIIDRGINFDYLEPERKEKLELFFSWFGDKLNS